MSSKIPYFLEMLLIRLWKWNRNHSWLLFCNSGSGFRSNEKQNQNGAISLPLDPADLSQRIHKKVSGIWRITHELIEDGGKDLAGADGGVRVVGELEEEEDGAGEELYEGDDDPGVDEGGRLLAEAGQEQEGGHERRRRGHQHWGNKTDTCTELAG